MSGIHVPEPQIKEMPECQDTIAPGTPHGAVDTAPRPRAQSLPGARGIGSPGYSPAGSFSALSGRVLIYYWGGTAAWQQEFRYKTYAIVQAWWVISAPVCTYRDTGAMHVPPNRNSEQAAHFSFRGIRKGLWKSQSKLPQMGYLLLTEVGSYGVGEEYKIKCNL